MHLNLLTIRRKITLLAGLCLVLVVALLMGLSLYQTHESSQHVATASGEMLAKAAREHMQALGNVQAMHVQRTFMQTHEYGPICCTCDSCNSRAAWTVRNCASN